MFVSSRRSRALPAFVLCGVIAASLAACGGGSNPGASFPVTQATATAGPTQNARDGQVRFVIQWPVTSSASSKRARHYLSPSTKSITIAGTGFTTVEVDNPNVDASASPSPTTTQTVSAPIGPDTFTVTDYDALKAAGHVLAANSVQFSVVMDQTNVVPITLDGNLASIVCAPVAPNVFDTVAGTNGAYSQTVATGQIILMPEDADANIIVAPGAIPALTLAATTPSQATVTPVKGTANEFDISPASPGVLVALTASGTNLSGATVTNTSCSDTLQGVYHPGDDADAFTMAGTLKITYDRSTQYPTPEPTSTSLYNVTQSITVTNPATFNGASGVDFHIAETDAQTAPAAEDFSDTQDQYYQYSNNMYSGNFLNLGYTETDDTGYTTTVTDGANDMLADVLPETSGAKWTNTDAKTITTNDGSGETSSTTYADNGSYTGTISYEDYMPSPNPTGSPQLTNQATLTASVDGSADYKTPRLGTALKYNYDYHLDAPSASGSSGTIAETTTIPPAVGSTSTPEAVSTTIANWMPATVPGSLYSETDIDNGPIALPKTCNVPAALTGTPNQVVQTKTSVDPLNGELDVTTTTTYDTLDVGPICVVLSDVQTDYYDFSGQNGTGYFSATPQQITTVAEILSLSAETVQSIARKHDASARADLMRGVNVAMAQGHIAILRAKQRLHRLAPHSSAPYRSFRGMLK